MKLFIDTWGWVTLYNRREERHEEVKAYYRRLREQRWTMYTSDYVLDETFTLLFKRLPFEQAKTSLDALDRATREGYLVLEWITPERFERAKLLRLRFQDKPLISFTDLSSMTVMEELDTRHVLTADAHFSHVGMGLQVVP